MERPGISHQKNVKKTPLLQTIKVLVVDLPDLRSIKGGLSDGWTPGRMLLITSIQTPANHDQLLLVLGCTLTNVRTCALAKYVLLLGKIKDWCRLLCTPLHCIVQMCKALLGFLLPWRVLHIVSLWS